MLYAMCIIFYEGCQAESKRTACRFLVCSTSKVAESWTGQDSWAAEVDSQEVSRGHDPILLLAGG